VPVSCLSGQIPDYPARNRDRGSGTFTTFEPSIFARYGTGVPDEDLEETLALIRAKLVELEKAFKHGRPAFKLLD
jgi:hypothetical protein